MDPTDSVVGASASVSGTIAENLGSPRFVGSTGLGGIWKHILKTNTGASQIDKPGKACSHWQWWMERRHGF